MESKLALRPATGQRSVPVDLVLDGCLPDDEVLAVCLREACRLGRRSPRVLSFTVRARPRGAQVEVRIDLRLTEGGALAERVAAAAGARSFPDEIREAFARLDRAAARPA